MKFSRLAELEKFIEMPTVDGRPVPLNEILEHDERYEELLPQITVSPNLTKEMLKSLRPPTCNEMGLEIGVDGKEIRRLLTSACKDMKKRSDDEKFGRKNWKTVSLLTFLFPNMSKTDQMRLEDLRVMSIQELALSTRPFNILNESGQFVDLGVLMDFSVRELSMLRGMGSTSIKEIREKLSILITQHLSS